MNVTGPLVGFDVALLPGYTVTGRITAGGAPASTAVWLNTEPGSNFYAAAFASTDGSGLYRIVVPAGSYYVRVVLGPGQIFYWNGPGQLLAVCPCKPLVVDSDRASIDVAIP